MTCEREDREIRRKRVHEDAGGRNVRSRAESLLALPAPGSDELDNIPLVQSLRPQGFSVGLRSQASRRGMPTDVPPLEGRTGMEIVPTNEISPQSVMEEETSEIPFSEAGNDMEITGNDMEIVGNDMEIAGNDMEAASHADILPRPAKDKATMVASPHPGDEGLPPGEEAVFPGSCSGMFRAQLGVEASTFNDFRLATEVFNGMLLPADANMLLSGESGMKPAGVLRKDALENFIRQAHYLNGLMERCRDLTLKARKSDLEADLFAAKSKRYAEARDQLSEENTGLLQTIEANSATIKSLEADRSARDTRIKELEVEQGELLKRNGELQCTLDDLRKETLKRDAEAKSARDEVEARIQAARSQAVATFRSSEEFKTEMVRFSFSTYERGADMIRRKIAAKYPDLDMSFLGKE